MSPSIIPTISTPIRPNMSITNEDSVSITNILTYWFRTSFPPPEDAPFRSWWFNATPDQDAEILVSFHALWSQVVQDGALRKRWSTARDGKMALLILLDQMPRNMFRGTANMFASDSLALPLAKEMVNDDLTSVEKMFVFTAIQHAESLECAKMAEEGLKTLVKKMAGQKRQRKYMKLLPAAKSYITMLENFRSE